MLITHNEIKKSVIRSQHTQRNWDLEESMSKEDIDLLVHAAVNCPSKQNKAQYKIHVITNRKTIENIHNKTKGLGFTDSLGHRITTTNSQTLAHVLFAFEAVNNKDAISLTKKEENIALRDKHMAVGIAAGYLNVIASQLGYGTGCCACGDIKGIEKLLGFDGKLLLMMGIGIGRKDTNRRVHHVTGEMMPTHKKEEIEVSYIT